MASWRHPVVAVVLLFLASCRPAEQVDTSRSTIPVYTYEVVRSYPHDTGAFTQGLQYHDGYIYESTGLHGRSSLRQVELETGRVLRRVQIPSQYFGEGLAIVGDRIHMLTWRSRTGFLFDLETFQRVGQFSYDGEGWGLAYDGTHLVMSDGTHQLRFLDPTDHLVVRTVDVVADGEPVAQLNELAWINGEIWANVFKTDLIARIDPATGQVVAWVNLHGILPPERVTGRVDVLNGIAYHAEQNRIFVTGKLWPRLFEIRLVGPRDR